MKIEDARKEERAIRDSVTSKRQEIDSIQSILAKLKNVHSIADIDKRVRISVNWNLIFNVVSHIVHFFE